jgi:hypothetical protein
MAFTGRAPRLDAARDACPASQRRAFVAPAVGAVSGRASPGEPRRLAALALSFALVAWRRDDRARFVRPCRAGRPGGAVLRPARPHRPSQRTRQRRVARMQACLSRKLALGIRLQRAPATAAPHHLSLVPVGSRTAACPAQGPHPCIQQLHILSLQLTVVCWLLLGLTGAHAAPPPAGPSATSPSHSAPAEARTSVATGSGTEIDFQRFLDAVKSGANLVPLSQRIFSDHLTPVSAYRCARRSPLRRGAVAVPPLPAQPRFPCCSSHGAAKPGMQPGSRAPRLSVQPIATPAPPARSLVPESDSQLPSFLLESVVNGDQQVRPRSRHRYRRLRPRSQAIPRRSIPSQLPSAAHSPAPPQRPRPHYQHLTTSAISTDPHHPRPTHISPHPSPAPAPQGRYSFLGSSPALEVVATRSRVVLLDHTAGQRTVTHMEDPMQVGAGGRWRRGCVWACACACRTGVWGCSWGGVWVCRPRWGSERRLEGSGWRPGRSSTWGGRYAPAPARAPALCVSLAIPGPALDRCLAVCRVSCVCRVPAAREPEPQLAAGQGGGHPGRVHGRLGGLRGLRHRALRVRRQAAVRGRAGRCAQAASRGGRAGWR